MGNETHPGATFIADVFGPSTRDPIFLCSLFNADAGGGEPRFVTTRCLEDISGFAHKYDRARRGVYYAVNTLKPNARRRAKETISEINCLHADIDFKGVTAAPDEIRRTLGQLLYPPSIVNCSGHGLHALWLFKEAIPATPETIAEVEALLRLLADHVGGDPQAAEAARLLRLVGTHNTKNGEWIEVVTEVNSGRRYVIDDLRDWLELAGPAIHRKPKPNGGDAHDPFLELAERQGFQAPVDVEDRLRAMRYQGPDDSGIHATQLSVTAALLSRGEPVETVVALTLEATRAAAGSLGTNWNWRREERTIREMCASWLAKHPELVIEADAGTGEATPGAGRPDNAAKANAANPVQPVDLWGKFEAPPLPLGLLPDVIERFALVQGEVMGADPAGLAGAALAVCAAIIPDRIKIQVKQHTQGWTEEARLWLALIGPPSTKKSPIIREAARPLLKIDGRLWRAYLAAKAKYDALPKAQRKTAPPPPQVRVRLEDTTIEAAQEILKDSPDGVLCLQDELSGWFGAMDKYNIRQGGGKDRGFWLQAWNGGSYAYNRIGRGGALIENLSVSVLGGIQPDLIRRLAGDTYDDGLLQRLLPIVVRPGAAGQDTQTPSIADDYAGLIEQLHTARPPQIGNWNLTDTPVALEFDAEAHVIRQQLERKHLELMGIEIINKKLAAQIGKYDGYFARLCVVWHCIENARKDLPPFIGEYTAQRVAKFLHEFLLPHAAAFYAGILDLADDHDRLSAVAGYILAHQLTLVTNRDIQRGDRTMRKLTRRDTDATFEQLEALGWVSRTPGPRPSSPPRWVVNPECHRLFVGRAKEEAERRQREHDALSALRIVGR